MALYSQNPSQWPLRSSEESVSRRKIVRMEATKCVIGSRKCCPPCLVALVLDQGLASSVQYSWNNMPALPPSAVNGYCPCDADK
jgi:hypothetical protein